MRRNFRPRIAAVAAALVLAACGDMAYRQSPGQKAPGTVEEVVVTSTRTGDAGLAADEMRSRYVYVPPAPAGYEKYQKQEDNPVKIAAREPVSTFSIDVDTTAYSNMRRMLRGGELPPQDAIRVEELINYFPYADVARDGQHPFTVQTEVAPSPWKSGNQLLRVRIKAMDDKTGTMPPANLVFLVDVSGSMDYPDKLPLVRSSLKMLVKQLRAQDRIALVVYAGRTAVELPSTPASDKHRILAAIARLQAGGSTAGEAAIKLAYEQARAGFVTGGINRILLATDGDFNVGVADVDQLKEMVERERRSGVSLTTLGFGTGNYNDYLLEQLADVGNGNAAYIDSVDEARKVLVEEMGATLNTVAADVKLQVEFNPHRVAEYRLIGYENRMLAEEDFANDQVDAGEIGAGKTVTALYELTPVGGQTLFTPRRYETGGDAARDTGLDSELAFLRIRYKPPGASQSVLLSAPITADDAMPALAAASADFRFAAAVAAFGQLLRGSKYTGTWTPDDVIALATGALEQDEGGYRNEFVRLVKVARDLGPPSPVASAH